MLVKLASAILLAATLTMAGCSHNQYRHQSHAQYGEHHRKGHKTHSHHSLSPSDSSLYIY